MTIPPSDDAPDAGAATAHRRNTTWEFNQDVPWDPDHPNEMREWLQTLADQIITVDDTVTITHQSTQAAADGGTPLATYQFVVCSGKRLMGPDGDADDEGGAPDGDADDVAP